MPILSVIVMRMDARRIHQLVVQIALVLKNQWQASGLANKWTAVQTFEENAKLEGRSYCSGDYFFAKLL
jgi:hypothetical protein